MTQHCQLYIELMTNADRITDEWNALLDQALLEREHEHIDEAEYYRIMDEVKGLQNRYVELRDQAINADHIYWLGQVEEGDLRARDWHEQMIDERPV